MLLPSFPALTLSSLADLISNFIEGLKLAKLNPKRFLLQTGAKHYGFHIGPATSPSYEFDPRVTLENVRASMSNFVFCWRWSRSLTLRCTEFLLPARRYLVQVRKGERACMERRSTELHVSEVSDHVDYSRVWKCGFSFRADFVRWIQHRGCKRQYSQLFAR